MQTNYSQRIAIATPRSNSLALDARPARLGLREDGCQRLSTAGNGQRLSTAVSTAPAHADCERTADSPETHHLRIDCTHRGTTCCRKLDTVKRLPNPACGAPTTQRIA